MNLINLNNPFLQTLNSLTRRQDSETGDLHGLTETNMCLLDMTTSRKYLISDRDVCSQYDQSAMPIEKAIEIKTNLQTEP